MYTLEINDLKKPGSKSWTEQTVQVPKPDFCTLMNRVQDQNRLVKDLAISIFEAVKANHLQNLVVRHNQDEQFVKIDDVRMRMAVLQASNTKLTAKVSSLEHSVSELTKSVQRFFKLMHPVFQSDIKLVQEERPNHPMEQLPEDIFDEAVRISGMAADEVLVQTTEERQDIAECLRARNESMARLQQNKMEDVLPAVPEAVEEIQRTKPTLTIDVGPPRSKWEKCADRVTALQDQGLNIKDIKNMKYAHTNLKKSRRYSTSPHATNEAKADEGNDEGAGPSGIQAKAKPKDKAPEDDGLTMEYSEFSQESDSQMTAPTKTKKKTTHEALTKASRAKRQAMSDEDKATDGEQQSKKQKAAKRKKTSPQIEPQKKRSNRGKKDDDDDASTSSASSSASGKRVTRQQGRATAASGKGASSTEGSSSKTKKSAALDMEDLPEPVPTTETPRRPPPAPEGLKLSKHVRRLTSPPAGPASRRPGYDSLAGTRERIATLKDTLEHHHRAMDSTFEEMGSHLKNKNEELYQKSKATYDSQRLAIDDLRHKLTEMKDDFRTKLEVRRQERGVDYGKIPIWDLTGDEDDLEPKDEPSDAVMERTVINSSIKSGQEWSVPATPQPPGGLGFVQREGEFSLNALMGAASTCRTPIVVRNFVHEGNDYLHVYRLEAAGLHAPPSPARSLPDVLPSSQSTPKWS